MVDPLSHLMAVVLQIDACCITVKVVEIVLVHTMLDDAEGKRNSFCKNYVFSTVLEQRLYLGLRAMRVRTWFMDSCRSTASLFARRKSASFCSCETVSGSRVSLTCLAWTLLEKSNFSLPSKKLDTKFSKFWNAFPSYLENLEIRNFYSFVFS